MEWRVWSVECEVWSVMRNVLKCGVYSVECGV